MRSIALAGDVPSPDDSSHDLTSIDVLFLVNRAIKEGVCNPKTRNSLDIDPLDDVITSTRRERLFMASLRGMLIVKIDRNRDHPVMQPAYNLIRRSRDISDLIRRSRGE